MAAEHETTTMEKYRHLLVLPTSLTASSTSCISCPGKPMVVPCQAGLVPQLRFRKDFDVDISSQAENRGPEGALLRNTVYSGAGTGECHNSIHIKRVSSTAECATADETTIAHPWYPGIQSYPCSSGIGRNTAHRVNSNNRVVAYSRFIRCHSCICTVEYRIKRSRMPQHVSVPGCGPWNRGLQ